MYIDTNKELIVCMYFDGLFTPRLTLAVHGLR